MAKFVEAEIGITAKDKTKKGVKSAERSVQSLAKSVRKYGLQIGAATAAVYGAVRAAQKLVDAYRIQERAEIKLGAALKATNNQIGISKQAMLEYARELQRTTTYSDDAIINAEALMVTFTQIGRDVFPQAVKAAADMSAMFGQDLQQSVIQLGTALNDPIQGVGRLRRIGISFTEHQKEMIKTLMDAGDVMGAQKVILDELKREFGGVAEAAGKTALASLDRFKSVMGDVKEQGGRAIAEFFKPTVDWLTTLASKWADAAKAQNDYYDARKRQKQGKATAEDELTIAIRELENLRKSRERLAAGGEVKGTLSTPKAVLDKLDKEIATLALRVQSLQRTVVIQKEQEEKQAEINRKRQEELERQAAIEQKYREQWQKILEIQDELKSPLEKERDKLIEYLTSISLAWAKGSEFEQTRLEIQKKITDRLKEIEEQLHPKIVGMRGGREVEGYRETGGKYAGAINYAPTPGAGTPAGQLFSGTNANMAVGQAIGSFGRFGAILAQIAGVVGNFGSGLIQAIGSLSSVKAILDPITTILQGAMNVLGPLIDEILKPLQGALIVFGELIGHMIAPILKLLSPAITWLAKAFIWIYNKVLVPVGNAILWVGDQLVKQLDALSRPFKFVGDLLGWVGQVILTFGKNVGIAIWNITHPFRQKAYASGPGAFQSSAFTTPLQGLNYVPLNEIDMATLTTAGASAQEGTTGAGANYTAGRNQTFNIYISTDVIAGDDGMDDLALMIRNRIQQLEAIGL